MYNKEGKQIGELELAAELFDVATDPALVHEAVVIHEGNSRSPIAHTKTRGEVQGSGKKPWKQKGTGRARHGSRRSPIWAGGGITFGPRSIRNFFRKLNKKARQKALAMVLTDKLANGKFIVVDSLNVDDSKTKTLNSILNALPFAGKKILIISEPENKTIAPAARNLTNVSTVPAHALNVVILLRNDHVVATKAAIDVMTQTYNRA